MVQANLSNPDDPPHSDKDFDKVHLELSEARKKAGQEAAKKLRKKHTGAHPFSPKVQRMLLEIILWSKIIRYRSRRGMGTRQIRRVMTRLKIDTAFECTLDEAKANRKKIRSQLWKHRAETWAWRKQWMMGLAAARAAAGKRHSSRGTQVHDHHRENKTILAEDRCNKPEAPHWQDPKSVEDQTQEDPRRHTGALQRRVQHKRVHGKSHHGGE